LYHAAVTSVNETSRGKMLILSIVSLAASPFSHGGPQFRPDISDTVPALDFFARQCDTPEACSS
jgi:hypothetical protein